MSVYQVSLVFPSILGVSLSGGQSSSTWCPLGKRGLGTWAPGHRTWADLHYVLQLEAADAELLGAREQCEAKWRNHEKSCFDFWCRFQTKIVINQDPRNVFVLAIPKPFGFTCVLWSPSVLDSVSFAALLQKWNIMESFCKLLQYHIKFEPPVSRCFFFEAAMARIAKLSCLAVTAWAPAHGMASSIEQCSHAMPDFRCCFSSCGITSASWFILELHGTSQDLRDKAQRDDPWWSMM